MALSTPQRNIILCQCFTMTGYLLFSNGILFSFLQRMEIEDSTILFLLALPNLISLIFLQPFAFLSDKFGVKKIGYIGSLFLAISFALIIYGSKLQAPLSITFISIGIISFGMGLTLVNSGWFTLLDPLILPAERGRFFGTLRFSWQLVGLSLTLVLTTILEKNQKLKIYQYILIVIVSFQIIRLYFYWKIPSDTLTTHPSSFWKTIKNLFSIPGLIPFSCYIFFINLCTTSVPWVINLQQKEIFLFPENIIVLLNSTMFAGNLIGYFLGGKIVDRLGAKTVFTINHFLYGLLLLVFAAHPIYQQQIYFVHAISLFFFGMLIASSSVANTAALFPIVPLQNKSLSSAFNLSMISGGTFFGAFLASQIIKWKVLQDFWQIGQHTLTKYDTIFLFSAIMITLFVLTLGILPSTMNKNNNMSSS